MPKPQAAPSDTSSFEDILARLEHVVTRLEKGDLPLEESLAVFEEGIRLSRLGTQRLDDAERRVETLLSQGATKSLATQPLEGVDED